MSDQPEINWDEMRHSCLNLAEAMWTYYHALVAIQFTEEQAMILTLAYQQHLLSGSPQVQPAVKRRWFAR